jgi:hypothetical protein
MWFLYATITIMMWGSAYAVLTPLNNQVPPLVLQIILGSYLVVFNMCGLVIERHLKGLTFGSAWEFILEHPDKGIGYTLLYSLLLVVGGMFFLYGFATTDGIKYSAVIVAYTSIYPIITMFWDCVLFQNYKEWNLAIVIPGMVLCVSGTILLGFSKSF